MTLTSRSGVASSRRGQNAELVILAYIACRFAFCTTPIPHAAETKQMSATSSGLEPRYGLYGPKMLEYGPRN